MDLAPQGGASSNITTSNYKNMIIKNNRLTGGAYIIRLEDATTGCTIDGNTLESPGFANAWVVDEGSGNTYTNNTFGGQFVASGRP